MNGREKAFAELGRTICNLRLRGREKRWFGEKRKGEREISQRENEHTTEGNRGLTYPLALDSLCALVLLTMIPQQAISEKMLSRIKSLPIHKGKK